jgi:hypothetical protein
MFPTADASCGIRAWAAAEGKEYVLFALPWSGDRDIFRHVDF